MPIEAIELSSESDSTDEDLSRRSRSHTSPSCAERTCVAVADNELSKSCAPMPPKVDAQLARTGATTPNSTTHSTTAAIATEYARTFIEAGSDSGQRTTDHSSTEAVGDVHSKSASLSYPKRKRKLLHLDLNEESIAKSQTRSAAGPLPPSLKNASNRSVHPGNSVKAVLGYWRDSPVPEPDRKHAVAGSIDVLGRLRTRVQPHTVANEPISEYPLPSEPSANWVKFERIAFADHLVGLNNLQIKEYVRIVTQDDKANELPDQTLVRVAIARAMESGAYDNAATPPAAHGSEPQGRKTSNNSTDINTDLAKLTGGPDLCRSLTGKDLSSTRQPAQAHAMVPIVSLLETRAKVELAKAESAQGRVEKHAKLRQQLDASAVAAASSTLNVPTNGCTRSHNHRTRQATPPNSFRATDVVFHDGVKYARGFRGLFIGKLASRGSIINIDGEDYVEYRVLTKPALF